MKSTKNKKGNMPVNFKGEKPEKKGGFNGLKTAAFVLFAATIAVAVAIAAWYFITKAKIDFAVESAKAADFARKASRATLGDTISDVGHYLFWWLGA